jgi:hypothetical protein
MADPVALAEMLIRKPVAEVFEAFANPAVTARFWFTGGSGRLEPGATVRWEWAMYDFSVEVEVKAVEPGQADPGRMDGLWRPDPDRMDLHADCPMGPFVSVTNSGFRGKRARRK